MLKKVSKENSYQWSIISQCHEVKEHPFDRPFDKLRKFSGCIPSR
jgi:hypothetical protein